MLFSKVRGFGPHIARQQSISVVCFVLMGIIFWYLPWISIALLGPPPSDATNYVFDQYWMFAVLGAYGLAFLSVAQEARRLSQQRASPLEDPRLLSVIARLSKKAGLRRTPTFSVLASDEMPNAGAISSPFVGDVLISMGNVHRKLPDMEEDGVFAHEIAHIMHRDPLAMTLVVAGTRAFGIEMFLLWVGLIIAFLTGTGSWAEVRYTFEALAIVSALSVVYGLLARAHSRAREYLADMGAIWLLGPEYCNDLVNGIFTAGTMAHKISRFQFLVLDRSGWLSSHPSLFDRAAALRVPLVQKGDDVVARETTAKVA